MRATAKYLRVAPRKLRRLIAPIRGRDLNEALRLVHLLPSPNAQLVEKVIQSAMANAAQREDPKVDVDRLMIKEVYVDGGPTLKRWWARPRGQTAQKLRRTSHLTVVLEERRA